MLLINRPELIRAIAKKAETTIVNSDIYLDAFLEVIVETLASGEEVKIHRFGAFEPKQRKPMIGRNPQTGEAVAIAAKTVPVFRASREFKDAVMG